MCVCMCTCAHTCFLDKGEEISEYFSFQKLSCCNYLQPSSIITTSWNCTQKFMEVSARKRKPFVEIPRVLRWEHVRFHSRQCAQQQSVKGQIFPLANMYYIGFFPEDITPVFSLFSSSVILKLWSLDQ